MLADLSALTVLSVFDEAIRAILMETFRVVELLDEAVADVRAGRDMLQASSTLSLGWDEATGRGTLHETSPAEADRQAKEASALYELVGQLHKVPTAHADEVSTEARDDYSGAWMETIRTAIATHRPLWADDAALEFWPAAWACQQSPPRRSLKCSNDQPSSRASNIKMLSTRWSSTALGYP